MVTGRPATSRPVRQSRLAKHPTRHCGPRVSHNSPAQFSDCVRQTGRWCGMVTLKRADAVTSAVPAAQRLASALLMTMRALNAALLLVAISCGYGVPAAPPGQNGESGTSWMSARVEGEPWTTNFVSVQRHDAYLVLEGTKWLDFEATL